MRKLSVASTLAIYDGLNTNVLNRFDIIHRSVCGCRKMASGVSRPSMHIDITQVMQLRKLGMSTCITQISDIVGVSRSTLATADASVRAVL